jgi:proteasome lid subunit RPN8/RPN11
VAAASLPDGVCERVIGPSEAEAPVAILESSAGSSPRPATLILPDAVRIEVVRHLQAAAPLEGVGLLAAPESDEGEEMDEGRGEGGATTVRVVRFYPGTNGAASATRYTMPPEEVLAAFEDMRARGWRLGAIVHSHPRGPATPSPTDLREAYYPEALMVIVSLAVTPPEARAWWVGAADGRPYEVPIVGGGAGDVPAREERGGAVMGKARDRSDGGGRD